MRIAQTAANSSQTTSIRRTQSTVVVRGGPVEAGDYSDADGQLMARFANTYEQQCGKLISEIVTVADTGFQDVVLTRVGG